MPQRMIIHVIDDIDGSTFLEGDGRTVAFSIDGDAYEIDLSRTNADKFQATLSPYIAAARHVTATSGARSPGKRAQSSDALAKIRAWANRNGFTIPSDGSINLETRLADIAAH